MDHFDVIVIGAGPGGIKAAGRLMRAGKKVAIVEREAWGGTCLNRGCIPSKLLLGAIEPGRLLEPLTANYLATGNATINYENLQKRVKKHIATTSAIIRGQMDSLGRAIMGDAKILDKSQVEITSSDSQFIISADNVIIAAGSSPASFPGISIDHDAILDSTDLMFISKPPKSLIVVGAGAVGLELADFFPIWGPRLSWWKALHRLCLLKTAIWQRNLKKPSISGVTRFIRVYMQASCEPRKEMRG